MVDAAYDQINKVVDTHKRTFVVNSAKRQRYSFRHELDQTGKVTFDSRTIDQRWTDDYDLHTGLIPQSHQTMLGLKLRNSVRIFWSRLIRGIKIATRNSRLTINFN
ncbi:hypothetical protein AU05_16555 [Ectopseudomonas composti]|uniref:Transposase n=1 Tax=Ectopseudomonas composti TaxID=658457 RepID=A0ABN0SAS9_9GAMM|nr:hypothetical protein AU05_16555 [Pseudomonas composti]